jgi:hypothetical protein
MRFHCNTTTDETIAYLREQAIAGKQPPAVIDALDRLQETSEFEADLEKRDEELNQMEQDRDDLRDELSALVDSMQLASDILESIDKNRAGKGPAEFYDTADLEGIARQLKAATDALERHKS